MKYIFVLSCLRTMCKNVSYKEQGEPEKVLFYCILSQKVPEKNVSLLRFNVPVILRIKMSVN